MTQGAIDLDEIVAIDVHTHAERNAGEEADPVSTELLEAAARYFGGDPPQPTDHTGPLAGRLRADPDPR